MSEIDKVNKEYEDKSLGVFPFISKEKLTILKKGLYKKKKANYRGLSYIYDQFDNTYKTLLLGYYNIPEDIIIVPEGIKKKLSDIETKLLEEYIDKDFKELKNLPSLKPMRFDEKSVEYELAFQAYIKYKSSK